MGINSNLSQVCLCRFRDSPMPQQAVNSGMYLSGLGRRLRSQFVTDRFGSVAAVQWFTSPGAAYGQQRPQLVITDLSRIQFVCERYLRPSKSTTYYLENSLGFTWNDIYWSTWSTEYAIWQSPSVRTVPGLSVASEMRSLPAYVPLTPPRSSTCTSSPVLISSA